MAKKSKQKKVMLGKERFFCHLGIKLTRNAEEVLKKC